MPPSMTSDSVYHFNLVAEAWARTAALDTAMVHASLAAAEVSAGNRVLDAGCGSGLLLPALLDRIGPSGRIVALDSARRMLAIAARRHADPRIRYVCSDLASYDGIDGPFDTAVCCRFLHLCPDPLQAIVKIAGWLRPGGRLLVMHELPVADTRGESQTVGELRLMLSGSGLTLIQDLAVDSWSILAAHTG